ncbi:ubiquitin carboxyl-terminal hydrolase CYLD isoform X2 [Chiloscyllium plagiosum]|uniref:ubiquitin carboxyl-terminal hydrolase CYLD isoform X2 n=1 Tax=Chiloscyllium plagiosum TaxID=36176 RepID=UPI001CB884DD|nr:ubiquitin carboxyl-terminal hydrolase CYLD isoform X2 [Chiloscyllium plagiosum]
MGGIEEDKHYFIVMKEFTENRKKIQKGSLGYCTRSENELSAVVEFNKKTIKLAKVKQEDLQEISKDEAELLLEIQDMSHRCVLVQNENLFKSISVLQINDIVQVKRNRVTWVGIVKTIIKSRRDSGLELNGLLFRVECVEGGDHKMKGRKNDKEVFINAGDITCASNTKVGPSHSNDKENKLYSNDTEIWNKSPVGSQSPSLSPRKMGREKSDEISTSAHSKISKHSSKTFNSTLSIPGQNLVESDSIALEVESMVEVKLPNNAIVYGVIRWIGIPEGHDSLWAGIELDYELKDASDGTFEKNRYFCCEQNKATFIPLRNCKPDARFSSNLLREIVSSPVPTPVKTIQDNLTIQEDVPPVRENEVLQLMKGRMKGIQGHHNSCYLDSTIFSLFAFTSVVDSILHMPGGHSEKIQHVLREDIVNPLRKTGVVNADKVTKLRKLLGCDTFTSAEKDPEEFINVLLHEVLAVDPLLKIRSGQKIQESYCYQIILEKDEKLTVPTVQLLLERSFLSCDLKFEEIPSCLLVQMPRFGKQFKMFPKIIPSLELDITNLLNNSDENIPEITDCPQIGDYLLMSEDILAYTDLKQLDGFAKRLFCDAYMCMYQSPRMCLYK